MRQRLGVKFGAQGRKPAGAQGVPVTLHGAHGGEIRLAAAGRVGQAQKVGKVLAGGLG